MKWIVLSLVFMNFVLPGSLSWGEDAVSNSYSGTPGLSPVVISTVGTPARESDVVIHDVMTNRPNYFFPYSMFHRSGEVSLPDDYLIFRVFAERSMGFTATQSDMFSRLEFDEKKQQLRIGLRPEVEFYQWDTSTDSLKTIAATPGDIVFSFNFLRAYAEANGFSWFFEPLLNIEQDRATGEVVLSFDPKTPTDNHGIIEQFLMFTQFLPASVYSPIFNLTPEAATLSHKEQTAIMLEAVKHDGTFDVFSDVEKLPPAGSGPYYLNPKDLSQNADRVEYRRVPNHWRNRVHKDLPALGRFSGVSFTYYPDSAVRDLALIRGDVSYRSYSSKVEAMNVLKRLKDGYQLTELPDNNNKKVHLKYNINTLSDVRVRQAIAMVARDWDRVQGLEDYSGSATPSVFIPHHKGPNKDFYKTDALAEKDLAKIAGIVGKKPEELRFMTQTGGELFPTIQDKRSRRNAIRRALKLLEQAGYTPNPNTGLMESAEGQPLKLRMLLGLESKTLFIIESLKSIGIEVEEVRLDHSSQTQALRALDYDIIITGSYMTAAPQPSLYVRDYHSQSSPDQNGGMQDSDVDKLIDHMSTIRDLDEMMVIQRAIDKILVARAYETPLYKFSSLWLVHDSRIQPANVLNERISQSVVRDWAEAPVSSQ